MPRTFVHVWWTRLWPCFHWSAGQTESHSHTVELISGSFIQSHWPCMTLWPISMFSRILARPRPAVPSPSNAVPAGRVGRDLAAEDTPPAQRGAGQHDDARPEGQAPLRADEPSDVPLVALAQIGDGRVVDLVELLAKLFDHRSGRARQGGRWSSLKFLLVEGVVRSSSQSPAAPLMQIWTARPGSSITSLVRRSRTRPATSGTSHVWQMPMRHPCSGLSPASSATRRSGVVASASAVDRGSGGHEA